MGDMRVVSNGVFSEKPAEEQGDSTSPSLHEGMQGFHQGSSVVERSSTSASSPPRGVSDVQLSINDFTDGPSSSRGVGPSSSNLYEIAQSSVPSSPQQRPEVEDRGPVSSPTSPAGRAYNLPSVTEASTAMALGAMSLIDKETRKVSPVGQGSGVGLQIEQLGDRAKRARASEGSMATAGVPSTSRLWVISPLNSLVKTWDTWTFFLLMFTAVVTPYELAFLDDAGEEGESINMDFLWWVNRVVDVCFMFDVVLQCMMAYKAGDRWVNSQPAIFKHYLRTWFPLDFVSVIPFDLIRLVFGGSSFNNVKALRMLRIFRVLKLLRLMRASRILGKLEASVAVNYTLLKLCKYIGFALMICHWLACGFRLTIKLTPELKIDCTLGDDGCQAKDNCSAGDHGCGVEGFEVRNWVETYSWFEPGVGPFGEYIVALYWSVATISTLGYGDVIPVTDHERTYCVIATIIGGGVYAYTVASCTGIIAAMNESQTLFFRLMDTLNTFMAERQLPHWLQKRLRDYFKYRREVHQIKDWHHLLTMISPALRAQVAVHANVSMLRPCQCHLLKPLQSVMNGRVQLDVTLNCRKSIFCGVADPFIADIAVRMSNLVACPHEFICRVGQRATELFIVERGVVLCGDRGRVLLRGGAFGIELVVRDLRKCYSAMTLTHAVVAVIGREDLIRTLDSYPAERATLRRHAIRHLFRNIVLLYLRGVKRLGENMKKLAYYASSVTYSMDQDVSQLLEKQNLESNRFHTVNPCVVPVLMKDYIEDLRRKDPTSYKKFRRAQEALSRVVGRMRLRKREEKKRAEHVAREVLTSQLHDLLFREGLSKYEPIFEKQNLHFGHLADCDPPALCVIGVKLGDAVQILRGYRKLSEQRSAAGSNVMGKERGAAEGGRSGVQSLQRSRSGVSRSGVPTVGADMSPGMVSARGIAMGRGQI